MDKKVKTTEILIKEEYGDHCLNDSAIKRDNGERRPKGYVEIYDVLEDGKKKLLGRHNLVLYQGREWLAQRAVNQNNTNLTDSDVSRRDAFINWFGLGDGGVLPADPLDPVPPELTDTDLYARVMINATDSSAADYHVVSVGYPETGYYKSPFDSVSFEQDSLNDDNWLVIKIETVIGVDDANGNQLSEAGLFTSPSSSGGMANTGPFFLFARVTFPSIIKTTDRRLIFTWYLYV